MPCTLILFWCFDVCILEKQIRFFDTSWWLYPHCIISIWHSPGILHNTKHEFPLFIWTIHSTVLKLQITHRPGWPGPRAPGCPRCPRVWFAQSLVPAHCRGQGPSLAPDPGISRSQWISHHIPRRQFSFRTHDPKDKQYLSNVFFNRGIGTWIWVDRNKQKENLWLKVYQVCITSLKSGASVEHVTNAATRRDISQISKTLSSDFHIIWF